MIAGADAQRISRTWELVFVNFSGIITTILGKTATNTKDAGRERRVHHSKSLPLPFIGEGLFFGRIFYTGLSLYFELKQLVIRKPGYPGRSLGKRLERAPGAAAGSPRPH